jgi:hypothetical protein
MVQPWFDPNLYAWIPGTLLGVAGGVMGSLTGCLAPRGRARNLVVRTWFTVLAACAVLLAVGIVAVVRGQPYGVWFGLLFPGVDGTVLLGALTPLVLKRYREAEERRLAAKDLL